MALIGLKQLDSVLTGSLQVSGSAGVTGSIEVSGNISGSSTSTGSFGNLIVQGNVTASGTVRADAFQSVTGGTTIDFNDSLDIAGDVTASGNLDIAGNALFGEYIYHKGDTDTYIQYSTDQMDFVVGAANMIYLNEGGAGAQADKIAINNDSADVDFQVKGDNIPNLIRTDAANDTVGIGLQSTGARFHVSSSTQGKQFVITSGSTDIMTVVSSSGGRVGIGTATPGSTFHVWGTISGSDYGGNVSGSSTSTGSFGSVVVSDKVQGNLKIGEGIVYNDTNKRLGIGDPVPTSPESELHIKAATPEITIQRTDNNNDGVIDFQGSAGYVGAKIAHSGTDNNLVFHTYTGSTLKERLTITGGSASTKISGSAVSTGSFGALRVVGQALTVNSVGTVSGSATSTGSFGYMNVSGDTVIGGNLTLGDADTDSVSFGAEISSSIVPDADSSYDIGSSSKNWRFGYIEQLSATHVTASGNISGSATSTGSFGNMSVGRTITHDGDSDTKIIFTDDDINITVGNMNMIDFTEDTVSEITINESGADLDFRVESDDDTKAIYVNAGQNSIQLGSAATTHVTASGNISGSSTSTGSFGRVDTTGDIYASGRIYEAGSSVIDHATAMAIVFGG